MISIVKNGITNENKQTTENLLNWCIFSFSNKVIANSKITMMVDLIKVYHFFFFRMALSIIFLILLNSFADKLVSFVKKEAN
jgi:hypothetical protein